MQKLTQKRLREVLQYEPETGIWIRREKTAPVVRVGEMAGSVNIVDGYRRISVNGKLYKASRLAFLYMLGYFPEHEVDHRNRIRHDDRWCNLRHTSRQCNGKNCSISIRNTSGVTGVHWANNLNKWRARIKTNGGAKSLGCFEKLVDAVRARWNAEKKYNWSDCCTFSSAYLYLKEKGLV